MDQDRVRGALNQLLYPIDGAPDLSDATATRLVDHLIDGRLFAAPVEDVAAALHQALRDGGLPPGTATVSRRHPEAALMEFLGRVARRLDERRPFPPPRFTKLDAAQWDTFAAATPIARIDRPAAQLRGAIGRPFDDLPTGAGPLPGLLLRLRTGEAVALLGSAAPHSTSFVLLLRGPGDTAEAAAHFRDLAGLRPTDVTTL